MKAGRPLPRRTCFGPACPRCNRPLEPQAGTEHRCGQCRLDFTGVFTRPLPDPGPAVLPVGGDAPPCAAHASNGAVASCQRCGTFMCDLCRLATDGQVLCPPCFDRLAKEGALPSVRRTWRDHGRRALVWALVGIPLWIFGMILGTLAVVDAIRGLGQLSALGPRGSLLRCLAALGLGLGEIIGSLLFIGSMMKGVL